MLRWPEGAVRRVSVNSFGYGGTNAHTILDAAEEYFNNARQVVALHPRTKAEELPTFWSSSKTDAARLRLFSFSHHHESSIAILAANTKRFIVDTLDDNNEALDRMAYTLSDRRSSLRFRFCIAASTRDELVDSLTQIATGSDRATKRVDDLKLCFVFTGMSINGQ
jgi:acyl transferase domain-containing protein